MKNNHSFRCVWALILVLQSSCNTGIRDLDLINQQFQLTYNVDSTRGLDSTQLATLQTSKAIYEFKEKGEGTSHIQTGMLSKDDPFIWSLKNDSLQINQTAYRIQKDGKQFILRSDSAKILLSKQP